MKKTYIVPTLDITKFDVEAMIATSGPQTSDVSAKEEFGMDVKSDRGCYDVWDVDWSN